MRVLKLVKEDWPMVLWYVRRNFGLKPLLLLLKSYVTKILEYKGYLNKKFNLYVLLCIP